MIDILRIAFPIIMVIGAIGSLIVNIIEHGFYGITLQWLGAALLYTGLTFRNMK